MCSTKNFQAFAGRDASQAFLSYHRRLFPHSKAKEAFEKEDESVKYSTDDHADFIELCDRVNKVLPRLKSFAPWHYYVKAGFILVVAIGMEAYMHSTQHYHWTLAAILGLFYALIGKDRSIVA